MSRSSLTFFPTYTKAALPMFLLCLLFVSYGAFAQKTKSAMTFTVSMPQPDGQRYQVELACDNFLQDTLLFKMPVWMPGLYQVMHYADNVESFRVVDASGKDLRWEKADGNSWQVFTKKSKRVIVRYAVKATTAFVAANYLDRDHGYISPAGLFIHVDGALNHPVTVVLKPSQTWNRVATGLDSVAGKKYVYTAPDFDILYDCPILMGNLEELSSFTIQGIKHRFIGYTLGDFDRKLFIDELKRSVAAAIAIMGDIPYKQYTFIAIGPGRGGIEHLNSTAISFDGKELNTPAGRERMLSFLSHEYFHHYNVKRIRPVELGPFDYSQENRTNLLWVSEGFTSYYEYIMLKRAGLITTEAFLEAFQSTIGSYENKPGRLHQSLVQSSYDTWAGNPFDRKEEELYKTVSYYEKGTAMGMLLDLAIRQASSNKKSLDDVMRYLYTKYYQEKKRGFTEGEFQQACETAAGKSLAELFDYVYTTKEIDYNKYLAYAGLTADITPKTQPGGWLGTSTFQKGDSLVVSGVDWQSPAWEAHLRRKVVLLKVNGSTANKQQLDAFLAAATPGTGLKLQVFMNGATKDIDLTLGKKTRIPFDIRPLPNPDPLQRAILKSWLGE